MLSNQLEKVDILSFLFLDSLILKLPVDGNPQSVIHMSNWPKLTSKHIYWIFGDDLSGGLSFSAHLLLLKPISRFLSTL